MKSWMKILGVILVMLVIALIALPAVAAPSGGTPRVEAFSVAAGAGAFTNNHVGTVMLLQRVDLAALLATTGTVTVSVINTLPLASGSTVAMTNSLAVAIAGTSASTNNLDSLSLYVGWRGIVTVSGLGSTNGTTVLTGLQLPF